MADYVNLTFSGRDRQKTDEYRVYITDENGEQVYDENGEQVYYDKNFFYVVEPPEVDDII